MGRSVQSERLIVPFSTLGYATATHGTAEVLWLVGERKETYCGPCLMLAGLVAHSAIYLGVIHHTFIKSSPLPWATEMA
jgi:hypothetical protein